MFFIRSRTFPSLCPSLLQVLLVAGCASLGNTGIDGQACTGTVIAGLPQLSEAPNAALQAKAQFASGKGGVCAAKVFSITAPLVLYRVYDSSNPYSRLGGWWSMKRPSGSRDDYRAANGICKEWSALDRVVACEVRPGSQIVIGTTQSVDCADGTSYPRTAENQAYVPNDGKAGIQHMAACSAEADWP